MKQILIDWKAKLDINIIIVGNFNVLLTVIDRTAAENQ
jgi:hypothetical protein